MSRIDADADQLEQLLINLVRNAADACLEDGGGAVTVGWRRTGRGVEICGRRRRARACRTRRTCSCRSSRPSRADPASASCCAGRSPKAHGGTLTLENRKDARGCRARLTLPI